MRIKSGDVLRYRGCFGPGPIKWATVPQLEVTPEPRGKYGVEVSEVEESVVRENRVMFSFNDGHWAYGSQIVLPTGGVA